jgi:hypothetical protein
MPAFKNYTAELGTAGTPSSRAASSSDFGGATGDELYRAGEEGMQTSRRIMEANQQRDLIRAYRDAALLRQKAREEMDLLKQTGEPVTEKAKQLLDKETETYGANRETQRGRMLSQQHAIAIRTEIEHEARVHDAALVGQEAKDASTEIMQSNGVRLQSNPDLLPLIVAEQDDFVSDLTIPENLKKELKRTLNAEATKNAVRGWIEINPIDAKARIEKGEFDEHIEANARDVLLGNADTAIRAIETEKRIQRAEYDRQKTMTSSKAMVQAIVDAHSPDPEKRLTAMQISEMAMQTHADGSPLLDPSHVSGLFNIVEAIAKEGTLKTSQDVILDVVPRLGTITPEELTEIASDPNRSMSGSDYERWMSIAQEGQTALKSMRSEALRNVPGLMDIPPQMAPMIPGFSKAYIELEALTRDREQEYKENNKNPVDYYRSGEFEKDVLRIGRGLDIVGAGTEMIGALNNLKVGDVVNGFEYIGGDPDDVINSWKPAEDLMKGTIIRD